MHQTNNIKNDNQKIVSSTFIGIIFSIIISIVLTFFTALGISRGILQEKSQNTEIFIIQTISIFWGDVLGMSLLNKKKLIIGMLIAVGYALLLFSVGVTVYEGSFENLGLTIVSVALGFIISIGLKLINTPKKKYVKKHI